MNLDNVLIFILWLLSVRDLIAKNFDIPKNKRWSFLFYNNKEINEVPYCYQLKKIHDNSMPIQYNSKLILQMLIVLGVHTKYFENKAFCDRDRTIETKYLVSTLEASYINHDLNIMIDILEKMISYLCIHTPIDFIISLKGGNVLLVDKLISLHKNEIIHITYNRNLFHQSYGVTKSNRNDFWESISLQFENINELIRVSNLNSRKLNGIILDCSFSSGKGILSCVDDFNDLLEIFDSKTPMINSISQAITIYSHVGENIQEELKRRNCKIDYLFSLDEEVREMLYSQIYLENDQHRQLKNAKKILKELKKRNLLNNEYLI